MKALYHFLFLEMSNLFVLLVYYIIILFSALYNPSLFLFVRANRGSSLCLIWLYKIALKLMYYVVASLHLKALVYFNFFGFSANVVYVENWFVCVLLSCCYTCFVYASTLCYRTVQVQVLWWRMIKVMLIVQEHIHLTHILDKSKFMTYVKKLQE